MKRLIIAFMLSGAATLAMADGATLFKKCAICHGENAEKKSLNVSKVIAGWDAEKIVERLKGYRAKTLNQYGFGTMMQGQATKLTEEQMHEVAKYIQSLKPPQTN